MVDAHGYVIFVPVYMGQLCIYAWASALLVLLRWAMREASVSGTGDSTDFHALFLSPQ